jgi:DNA repair protein RecO (recombination protein O)
MYLPLMSLVTTPAVILHAFKYGESSKIVRMVTPGHGVQSAIAKGALRPKSRFGARLQVLSGGTARMYMKPNRDLHTLAEFEVTAQHMELTRDVKRFAAGTALAELVMRCSPAQPHPEVFQLVVTGLDRLGAVPGDGLEVTALMLLWAAIRELGFAPTLDACARDGRALPAGAVTFSVSDGGFLCAACGRSAVRGRLKPGDRAVLERLIAGDDGAVQIPGATRARAHRRLLARFIERHVAEGREIRALTFWAALP